MVQPGVGSAAADEFAGWSVFDDAARVDDEYAIGDLYGIATGVFFGLYFLAVKAARRMNAPKAHSSAP